VLALVAQGLRNSGIAERLFPVPEDGRSSRLGDPAEA
jgi:hypothetical protein